MKIESVWFEDENAIFHPEAYGLILKSFDAPPPAPKIYRQSIDGADGTVDMTEWAGVVRFNDRAVQVVFRDMESENAGKLLDFVHGRRIKVTTSENPDVYYYGRCEKADAQERKHITDVALQFTCEPYRLRHAPTVIQLEINGERQVALKAQRKPCTPKVTVDGYITLSWGGKTATLDSGTFTIPDLLITEKPQTMTISGSGLITLQWRDGVL